VEAISPTSPFIKGRSTEFKPPTSNGCVEHLWLMILEECWRPTFALSLVPKMTALRRDVEQYLTEYEYDRAHTGHLTDGRIPAVILGAQKPKNVR
jgi:hypothetical protein